MHPLWLAATPGPTRRASPALLQKHTPTSATWHLRTQPRLSQRPRPSSVRLAPKGGRAHVSAGVQGPHPPRRALHPACHTVAERLPSKSNQTVRSRHLQTPCDVSVLITKTVFVFSSPGCSVRPERRAVLVREAARGSPTSSPRVQIQGIGELLSGPSHRNAATGHRRGSAPPPGRWGCGVSGEGASEVPPSHVSPPPHSIPNGNNRCERNGGG